MVAAIVLAAGKSARMGRQKILLPWGDTTVFGKVLQTLRGAGVKEIIAVANSAVADQIAAYGLRVASNDRGGMIESLKTGLGALNPSAQAALVCLGDQPQIEEGTVKAVCEAFQRSESNIVIPSYRMRRGHPWLAARALWGEILALDETQSMRGFLNARAGEIEYVNVETPTILQDLDTPEDYLKYKPGM